MRRTMRLAATLLCLSVTTLAASAQIPLLSDRKDWSAPAADWWGHVSFLADDKLEGRRAGTPGYEKAVAYVEEQFKAIGLKPAGTSGYQQSFALIPTSIDTAASFFRISENGKTIDLPIGSDVTLAPGMENTSISNAPMVFLGYGLRIPRKHIDDFTGMDLKGKVVVFFNAPPTHLQGPQRAYARSNDQRWKQLSAAGAVGMISLALVAPKVDANAPARAGGARLMFEDPALNGQKGVQVSATIAFNAGEKLFEGSGHTYEELRKLANAGDELPHFTLPGTLDAKTAISKGTPVRMSNVIGMLEGSDSKLKKEYVVVSAHLDHLGIGRPVNGDNLYNGAMDNASGSASVIECAKLMAKYPHPKRSILFITLAGEELGELGSAYFATKPTVPKKDVVADLNMDMYLPLFPLRFIEVQGLAESTLGNDARAAFQLNDVEVQFDKQPDENRFVRSDQVNFVKQGIPALAFKFGWTPDSPEQKIFMEWVKTRYHKPSDDLQQPVDKVAAAQFTVVLGQLTTRVANGPRPEWYPESSFADQTNK